MKISTPLVDQSGRKIDGRKTTPFHKMSEEQKEAYRQKQRNRQLNLRPEQKEKQRQLARKVGLGLRGGLRPAVIGSRLVHKSVPELARKFVARIKQPRRLKKPERYQGYEGAFLFLRYYSVFRERHAEEHGAPITPRGIHGKIPPEVKGQIKWIPLDYERAHQIRIKLCEIDQSYNTEDGQMRWLIDNNYPEISLGIFWTLIPRRMRNRMSEWRYMTASPQKAYAIHKALERIDESYNTPDGFVRWLKDSKVFGMVTFAQVMKIIPKKVRKAMSEWPICYDEKHNFRIREQFKNHLSLQDYVSRTLGERCKFHSEESVIQISDLMWRARLSQTEILETLQTATENVSRFMAELREIYRRVKCQSGLVTEISVREMLDVYRFAQSRFGLQPMVTSVILKLQQISLGGVQNLVQIGTRRKTRKYRPRAKKQREPRVRKTPLVKRMFSFQAPPFSNPDGDTLENKIEYLDPHYKRIESNDILRMIREEGGLTRDQLEILEEITHGNDVAETDYDTLASTVRAHPYLMELLGK